MSYFDNVYLHRLNRYGNNYQERILSQRREVFNRMLEKSVYRIDFTYNNQIIPAVFERYKQNETEIFHYLFTSYDVIIPNGQILLLPDPVGLKREDEIVYPEYAGRRPEAPELADFPELRPWMVYYLEDSNAKGYNRYVMLKMTHYLTWKDRSGIDRSSYAYMYGQEDNMLKDEFQGRSRMDVLYTENLKMSFFILPANEYIRKDDYFIIDHIINHKPLDEYYRVTGYDIQSQDGVEYVTIDPIYEYAKDFYDKVKLPKDVTPEETEDYYWLMNQTTEEEE